MDVAAAKSERCFGIVSDENGGGIDKGDGDSRGAESPTADSNPSGSVSSSDSPTVPVSSDGGDRDGSGRVRSKHSLSFSRDDFCGEDSRASTSAASSLISSGVPTTSPSDLPAVESSSNSGCTGSSRCRGTASAVASLPVSGAVFQGRYSAQTPRQKASQFARWPPVAVLTLADLVRFQNGSGSSQFLKIPARHRARLWPEAHLNKPFDRLSHYKWPKLYGTLQCIGAVVGRRDFSRLSC